MRQLLPSMLLHTVIQTTSSVCMWKIFNDVTMMSFYCHSQWALVAVRSGELGTYPMWEWCNWKMVTCSERKGIRIMYKALPALHIARAVSNDWTGLLDWTTVPYCSSPVQWLLTAYTKGWKVTWDLGTRLVKKYWGDLLIDNGLERAPH